MATYDEYVLPRIAREHQFTSRITRGVPPKRYDSKYKTERSRYLVANLAPKNLSKIIVTYNITMHSREIPNLAKEDLRPQNGRKLWNKKLKL